MIIALGTTNVVKIEALEEVLKDYPDFAQANIYPLTNILELQKGSSVFLQKEELIESAIPSSVLQRL